MDVLGRDSAREAYRVAIDGPEGRVVGLIPDAVISRAMPLTGGRGHQTAYEWLSRNANGIEQSLNALKAGQMPALDGLTLEEDA